MKKPFELTPVLVDSIIFAMENQEELYSLDMIRCVVILSKDREPEQDNHYVDLPRWHPSDGFTLMEKFVQSLKNTVYRETLYQALSGGKGVFRRFKDELKKNREIEKLWFAYKENHMRTKIRDWYEETCEKLGLESMGPEPEDTEELVLDDFTFDFEADWSQEMAVMDRKTFFESRRGESPDTLEKEYARRLSTACAEDGSRRLLAARAPDGELVGLLWARIERASDSFPVCQVYLVAVCPEFRGLGLGRELVRRMALDAKKAQCRWIDVELRGEGLVLSSYLEREKFDVAVKVYRRALASS